MTERLSQIIPVSDSWKRNYYNRFLLKLGFPILAPVKKLANIDRSQSSNQTFLNLLAEELGLNTPEYQNLLKEYDSQLSKIRWFNFWILVSLFYSLIYHAHKGFILYVFLFMLSVFSAITKPVGFLIIGGLFIVLLLICWVNHITIKSTIRGIWEGLYKQYGESFCIRESLAILYLLKRDDAIDYEYQKEDLCKRMLFLADTTKLLGERKARRYRVNRTRKREIKEHYQRMASEIEERASWLGRPGDMTLDDLRGYFNELARDYITGRTGNFQWQDPQENNKTNLAKFKEAIALIKEVIPIINPIISTFKAIGKIIKPL